MYLSSNSQVLFWRCCKTASAGWLIKGAPQVKTWSPLHYVQHQKYTAAIECLHKWICINVVTQCSPVQGPPTVVPVPGLLHLVRGLKWQVCHAHAPHLHTHIDKWKTVFWQGQRTCILSFWYSGTVLGTGEIRFTSVLKKNHVVLGYFTWIWTTSNI